MTHMQMHRLERSLDVCLHFLIRLRLEVQSTLAPICFSPLRKMEADISGQFFVRNIHLHEEKRVKNLICKAI
jgi:hypothetical protein